MPQAFADHGVVSVLDLEAGVGLRLRGGEAFAGGWAAYATTDRLVLVSGPKFEDARHRPATAPPAGRLHVHLVRAGGKTTGSLQPAR